MGELETALRTVRDAGGRAFVPYVTGGYPGVDAALLRALADAGADAIEVGIPHSDPIIDGGVVQEASRVALERGTHPRDVLATIAEADLDVPVAVMTYANIVTRPGLATFVAELAAAGVRGADRAGSPRRRGRRARDRGRGRTRSTWCSWPRRAPSRSATRRSAPRPTGSSIASPRTA